MTRAPKPPSVVVVANDFKAYRDAYANGLVKLREDLAKHETFRMIETTALALAYLSDKEQLEIVHKDTDTALVVHLLIAKTTIESFAFVGALRNGAMEGALHHVRTLLEIRAILRYLFHDATKVQKRVGRYMQWSFVASYLRLARLREAWKEGLAALEKQKAKLHPEEYERQKNVLNDVCGTEEQDLIAIGAGKHTDAEVKAWKKLYGDDFSKEPANISAWHHGRGITDLVRELGPLEESFYDMACNATHVSPIGHRFVAPHPVYIGWPEDEKALTKALHMAAMSLTQLVADLDAHCGGNLAYKVGLAEVVKTLKATAAFAAPPPGPAV